MKTSKTKTNLWIDITIALAFLVALEPALTGFSIHEWLGLAFGGAIVVHLLMHWQWLVSVTKGFFRRLAGQPRINYILNALLFIAVTLIVFSGVMISEEVMPLFGIQMAGDNFWRFIHVQTSDLSLFLVGLHIALHWKWILNALKRYIVAPIGRLFGRNTPKQTPVASIHMVQEKI